MCRIWSQRQSSCFDAQVDNNKLSKWTFEVNVSQAQFGQRPTNHSNVAIFDGKSYFSFLCQNTFCSYVTLKVRIMYYFHACRRVTELWLHDASGWNLSSVCVCPSGTTPCSTPPALMRIWTIDTHRHTHIGTYTPLRRNSWKKLPTLLPILPPSWFLPSFPQSLRTHPGVHFSSLAHFSCLFSVLISPSIFESHWTAYRYSHSVWFL